MKTKITISRNDILGRWTGERVTSVLALVNHGKFHQITVSPVLWQLFSYDKHVVKFSIELRTLDDGRAVGFINDLFGTVILVDDTMDGATTIIAIDKNADYTEFDLTDVFS